MSRRPTQPSRRLLAAAAAERADIDRQRDALAEQRRRLQAQIDDLDAELAELADRALLIERLAGPATSPAALQDERQAPLGDKIILRGPEIRQTAVTLLVSDPAGPRSLHYRDWFALLEQHGYAVAGKDPVAVFLTQISRSPVIHRGTQSGMYEVQLNAPAELGRRLDARHRELRALTIEATSATDLTKVRARRTSLNREIDKLEKALVEARATLGTPSRQLAATG
jgi:septal ring factor EnvC (AmiA/AmiB activator)